MEQRNFGLLPLLGFTTIMLNSWESVFLGPTLIYAYIFYFFGSLETCASISEIASMYPTSGGQYHWTVLLAPPKWSKFLSWLTGLPVLNNPSYNYRRWHRTLLLYAVLMVSVFVNTVAVRISLALEGIILVLQMFGFLAILIPLVHLALQPPAEFVFAAWSNGSGYPDGLSWLVGLFTSSVLFIWSMVFTIFLNGVFGLAIMMAILFSVGSADRALGTRTGYPFIEIFRYATQSNAGATAITSILIATMNFATLGFLASASRQMWVFARDQGLLFSCIIARVDRRWAIPLYSIGLTALINSLLALINIGSTVAFNAIVSLVAAGLFYSYIFTISLMIRKRLIGEHIPFGPWNMGKYGLAVNLYALLYTIIVTFFSLFPPATPVTAVTMDWSCAIFSATVIFGLIFWAVSGRYHWQGSLMDRRFAQQAQVA
ncbi:hypothetical protein K469DRAFT_740232 [Zopfia rhizophila CBS 207.26]|uniref:Amino acid transporter n=1 Tax=Zopfia rhizophila CBS 207.26 TaxID=1314779 RepID=A0A6A6DWI2_9PEZI|nr:hypothetical protein K469DRAFT_740232 [Zopfia rhizophila CBS 207.26]